MELTEILNKIQEAVAGGFIAAGSEKSLNALLDSTPFKKLELTKLDATPGVRFITEELNSKDVVLLLKNYTPQQVEGMFALPNQVIENIKLGPYEEKRFSLNEDLFVEDRLEAFGIFKRDDGTESKPLVWAIEYTKDNFRSAVTYEPNLDDSLKIEVLNYSSKNEDTLKAIGDIVKREKLEMLRSSHNSLFNNGKISEIEKHFQFVKSLDSSQLGIWSLTKSLDFTKIRLTSKGKKRLENLDWVLDFPNDCYFFSEESFDPIEQYFSLIESNPFSPLNGIESPFFSMSNTSELNDGCFTGTINALPPKQFRESYLNGWIFTFGDKLELSFSVHKDDSIIEKTIEI